MFKFRISVCLFVASVVFMCCRFSNQPRFEMQAPVNTPSVSLRWLWIAQLSQFNMTTFQVFMAICELLYSQTNKLYLCFALYILWKRNGPPVLPAVSRTVCIEPMSSLLCLHVSLGQFLFNYKNYCHFYLPQSSCCVVIVLASHVIPLHHLDSLTFRILCQSVQLAKHFSLKCEYNSTRLFGELCGVWCQLSQHMDLDLPCQCSHIICSDYNNLHPAPPQKKSSHAYLRCFHVFQKLLTSLSKSWPEHTSQPSLWGFIWGSF